MNLIQQMNYHLHLLKDHILQMNQIKVVKKKITNHLKVKTANKHQKNPRDLLVLVHLENPFHLVILNDLNLVDMIMIKVQNKKIEVIHLNNLVSIMNR